MSEAEKKGNKIFLMITLAIIFVTGAILAFIYWFKPTYLDEQKPNEEKETAPPRTVNVDTTNLQLIKSLSETTDMPTIQNILRNAKAA